MNVANNSMILLDVIEAIKEIQSLLHYFDMLEPINMTHMKGGEGEDVSKTLENQILLLSVFSSPIVALFQAMYMCRSYMNNPWRITIRIMNVNQSFDFSEPKIMKLLVMRLSRF